MSLRQWGLLLVLGTSMAFGAGPDLARPVSRPLLQFANEPGLPIQVREGAESLLMIHYGEELDPERFHATLNGSDVTSWFHPAPRTSESMKRLPFKRGANRLEFDVWRMPRPDLPPGTILENELHQVDVTVLPAGSGPELFIAGEAPLSAGK